MREYEQWKVTSKEAKKIYDEIFKRADYLESKNSAYTDLMVRAENAFYRDKQIEQSEYDYLVNFIAKCCEENTLKTRQTAMTQEQARKDVYKAYSEKGFIWKFFNKKKKPTAAINRLSTEELIDLADGIRKGR